MGDAVAKACEDYRAQLAERDAKIVEPEGEIAESTEKPHAEMDELRRKGGEQRVGFELKLAGARNVKVAQALLAGHGNGIEKLKRRAGLSGEDAAMRRLRKIACLDGEAKTFNHDRGIKTLA